MGRQRPVESSIGARVAASADDGFPGGARPRILMVTDRLPSSDSGYGLRVTNVLDGLQAAGDLEVLVLDSSRRGERFEHPASLGVTVLRAEHPSKRVKFLRIGSRLPTSMRYRNHTELARRVREVLDAGSWDVVWYSRATAFLYAELAGTRQIVDFDDLNDRLLRSKMADRRLQHGRLRTLPRNLWDAIDAARWTSLQRRVAARVDRVVVCSRVDERRLGVPNCAVVPNGYPEPTPSVTQTRSKVRPPTMLFVGPLHYEPNQFAVEWMVRRVLPLVRAAVPNARLLVAGDTDGVQVRTLQGPGVELVGWVPDIAKVYDDADVAVTPLHSGGGTRLKVMEALARGLPLVSTSFGCEGLELTAGRDVLVADDEQDFADACVAALRDDALRQRLMAAGRERYVRSMSSTVCSHAVTSVVRQVLTPAARGNTRLSAAPPTSTA